MQDGSLMPTLLCSGRPFVDSASPTRWILLSVPVRGRTSLQGMPLPVGCVSTANSLPSACRLPPLLPPLIRYLPAAASLCPHPRTLDPRPGVRGSAVQPHSQPERVPSLGDEAREPGQAPSVHFNPLVEVVPPRAPRPVVKVVFVNARLQRKRPVLQKDPESSKMNVIFFFFS